MRTRRDRGFSAVELIVLVVVVGLVAAVTVPALLRGSRNVLVARCEANLVALGIADKDAGDSPARGAAYWERLVALGKVKPEMLTCPLSGKKYLGPAGDPKRLLPKDPIGGDPPGSHGDGEGGHILSKSGEVRAWHQAQWKAAAASLAP